MSWSEPQKRDFSEEKFRELIVYIANRCQYSPTFGETKLNKILFFSDVICYAKHGHSITGEEYVKQQFGPISRHLLPVREKMDGNEVHVIQKAMMSGRTQTRTVPIREADVDKFSAHEIEVVDWVIEQLKDHNAESVSELSHMLRGWQITPTGETIPYEAIFLPSKQEHNITPRELERLRALAKADGVDEQ